jgi:hypothetical protein
MREHSNRMHIIITLIILVVVITIGLVSLYRHDFATDPMRWGVTFSAPYARDELHLDWRETYLAILDDLQVRELRLSAYWNEIEKTPGVYQFADLDWQITEAATRGASITLAVGRRLPRWPECHAPQWVDSLDQSEQRAAQLDYVRLVVERYQANPAITRWQIENEPYLDTFGMCPPLDRELFMEEIALVRELSDKPILITDSGELSTWLPAARSGGDTLGTTMYRVVHNEQVGYFSWPLPPAFYALKARAVKRFSGIPNVIIAELQAEPWPSHNQTLRDLPLTETDKSFSVDQFQDNLHYAERTGLSETYLWGAEWWYSMQKQEKSPRFWELAKTLWE